MAMGKFNIESTDPAISRSQVEAQSFTGALSKVLGRFSPGSDRTVNVDVSSDGQAELWDPGTDQRFHIEPDVDTTFDLGDAPTPELWDAPTPGSGAKRAREMSPIDHIKAVESVRSIQAAATELEACNLALNVLMTHIPAESSSILLAEADALRFVCVRGPKAETLTGKTIAREHGVAGAVVNSGKPLHIRQARKHEKHHTKFDQSINHFTRTLLALPITVDGTIQGVLELLNPFGSDRFAEPHQTFAHAVALALGERLRGPQP